MKTALAIIALATLGLLYTKEPPAPAVNPDLKATLDAVVESADKPEEPKQKVFYIITSLYPKPFRYITWAYEETPSGSVKFINVGTKREVIVSQPFTIEEKLAGKGW
jgi:hypothetical protein